MFLLVTKYERLLNTFENFPQIETYSLLMYVTYSPWFSNLAFCQASAYIWRTLATIQWAWTITWLFSTL